MSEDISGSKVMDAGKIHKFKHWDPPPIGWLKWKTFASRIGTRHKLVTSYVCRDNTVLSSFSVERELVVIQLL